MRPLDRPFSKQLATSPASRGSSPQTQAFLYLPDVITDMAPTPGQTVDVPTLQLDAGLGADAYTVTIKANGETVDDRDDLRHLLHVRRPRGLPAGNPYTLVDHRRRRSEGPSR